MRKWCRQPDREEGLQRPMSKSFLTVGLPTLFQQRKFMFTLFEPSEKRIEDFLAEQRDLPFSYREVGATRGENVPADYPINHLRLQIGGGAETFARAKEAVRDWTMYQLDWTRLVPAGAPIEVGAVVCAIVNHGFCWSLNPCRIIYVSDAAGKFSFAFGTLPGHSEQGEERFTIERNSADDSVWYEVFAFARPQHVLAKIGFPFVPYFQRRFARESAQAMVEKVKGER